VKEVRRTLALAESRYRVRAYPGRVVLFRASDRGLRGLEDPREGWHKYAQGGLQVEEIEGDHGNILNEPKVQLLAARLRACFESASERGQFLRAEASLPQAATQMS